VARIKITKQEGLKRVHDALSTKPVRTRPDIKGMLDKLRSKRGTKAEITTR